MKYAHNYKIYVKIEFQVCQRIIDFMVSVHGLESNTLMKTHIEIIDQNVCNKTFFNLYEIQINPHVLCAGTEDGMLGTCQGDSGGPLVAKSDQGVWTLHGVTSFGTRDCETNPIPGAFTRTKSFVDWIRKNMA